MSKFSNKSIHMPTSEPFHDINSSSWFDTLYVHLHYEDDAFDLRCL